MPKTACLFVLLILLLVACQSEYSSQQAEQNSQVPTDSLVKDTMPMYQNVDSFQTISVAGHAIDLAPPIGAHQGNLLILQGYNFPKHDWCEKAPQLCEQARAAGYLLIMPEMGKSVYSTHFFPETAQSMKAYPLRSWLTDSLFPHLQAKHQILLPRQNNFIIGLSTGGRGAALLTLDRPELFDAVAALSGDYDQTQMPADRLMTVYYGPFAQQKERWATVDNVLAKIEDWQTPIYLGHGQSDRVVPPAQTRLFYDSLLVHFDSSKVQINEPTEAAHDYDYWGSETEKVLAFFKQWGNGF